MTLLQGRPTRLRDSGGRGRNLSRSAGAIVLVVGLVITAILALATFRSHQRTEGKLLVLQTKLKSTRARLRISYTSRITSAAPQAWRRPQTVTLPRSGRLSARRSRLADPSSRGRSGG